MICCVVVLLCLCVVCGLLFCICRFVLRLFCCRCFVMIVLLFWVGCFVGVVGVWFCCVGVLCKIRADSAGNQPNTM